MPPEDHKLHIQTQYDLIRAELRAKNVYSRKQSDRILQLLIDVENKIWKVASELRKSFAEVLQEFEIVDPEMLLEEGMCHWDEKLKTEVVPSDPELLQQLRSFGLRVKKVCRVFIPTDELDVPEGNGEKSEERERIDHNRVSQAVQTLLSLEINETKLKLEDIQIQMSNSPQHSWRERAYWCLLIPNLRVAVLLNNQYGNRTFVVKYVDGRELGSLIDMKKSELKDLANALPAKIHHFDYTEEGQFRGKLAEAVLRVLEGKEQPRFYATYEEAKKAVQRLGIKTATEYQKRYEEDPRLPANPRRTYRHAWTIWHNFLRNDSKEKRALYPTLAEAKSAAQQKGIKTATEYQKRYKEDPRLPSNPPITYRTTWTSWPNFLCDHIVEKKEKRALYPNLAEAKSAVQQKGIKTVTEYQKRHEEDPRLPATPSRKYKEWISWPDFLRNKSEHYSTLREAKIAVQGLEIKTFAEYMNRYKEDPRLPAAPYRKYKDDWISWLDFLGTAQKS